MNIPKIVFMSFCMILTFFSYDARAEDQLNIIAPYALETIPQAKAGAVFLEIDNSGTSDKLIKVDVDSVIAERAELHTHIKDEDVMKMRKVDSIDVAEHKKTILSPGGDHVMLMGLKKQLKAGEKISLKMTFEKSGEKSVIAEVRPISTSINQGQSHGDHHHHMH